MKKLSKILLFNILLFTLALTIKANDEKLYWPPSPDEPRIEYVGEIDCQELIQGSGFFAKLKKFISGNDVKNNVVMPFDIEIDNNKMFLTCQGIPYLIEINLEKNSFKKIEDEDAPFNFPVCLSNGGDGIIFITDSENRAVYKYHNGNVKLFIDSGLIRPTGITSIPSKQQIYIVDTGEHSMKIFNYQGEHIRTITADKFGENNFHFPTFATSTADGSVLVNDALNYQVKRFDADGEFISAFGSEGDGPGTFSRPKGIATDSEGNIYVIDNLFDNLQIFDSLGHLLLVVGSVGNQKGQFYSPSGLAINNDTVYIADTYNNRIQVLHFLGGPNED